MPVNDVCKWPFLMMALCVLEDGVCKKCHTGGGDEMISLKQPTR